MVLEYNYPNAQAKRIKIESSNTKLILKGNSKTLKENLLNLLRNTAINGPVAQSG